jgi:hypothetical protein
MEESPKIESGYAALPEQGPVVNEAGAATVRLAGRWVRRVQATYNAELEKSGLHAGTDIVCITCVFNTVTSSIVANGKLFRSMQGLFQ